MSLISIIVPCYNEEAVLDEFYKVASETLADLEADKEFVFVDDGSKDKTYEILKKLKAEHNDVHYVSFSRNFGKEAAIFAGLRNCNGDAAVVIDADLQHPPRVIYDMYELWKQGYEVIEGIKSNRGREGIFHKMFAGSFYKMISGMMGIDMNNSSDFKFLDRKVIDVLSQLKERNTFFRALSFWTGFNTNTVSYEVQDRAAGSTKWSFKSLVKYALNNLTSFTFAPLYWIITIGVLFFLLGIGLAIDAIVDYFNGNTVAGYPTLIVLFVIATACILLSVGIIGVYIAKIYDEIKQRPQYIIRDKK